MHSVEAVAAPLVAAKGDDDLMSAPPKPVVAEVAPVTGAWPQQIDAAQVTWDKLSRAELARTEGVELRLIALIQKRYVTTRVRATRQVKTFFEEQAS